MLTDTIPLRDVIRVRYSGSQAPAWEPRSRSSSFARLEAGASRSAFPSRSLGTSTVSQRQLFLGNDVGVLRRNGVYNPVTPDKFYKDTTKIIRSRLNYFCKRLINSPKPAISFSKRPTSFLAVVNLSCGWVGTICGCPAYF